MTYIPWMFEGEWVNGRLSNELWLAKNCPQEFRDPANSWNAYITALLGSDSTSFENWQWKRFHERDRAHELEKSRRELRFLNLIQPARSQLRTETRTAVLAWMLSNMLTEPPTHQPLSVCYHSH